MICGIYTITNKINNKIYIGQSNHCKRRFSEHKSPSSLKKAGAIYLAFKKYGIENFEFKIIHECLIEELNDKEIFYIKELNTLSPNGYNLNSGGNVPIEISEETRKKMSKAQSGKNNPMYGKERSEEHKEKLSIALKGRKLTEEHIQKIGKANTGKNHTEESKEKNRQAHLGKKLPKEIIEQRKYSELKNIRKLLYTKESCGFLKIENNISIKYVYKKKRITFNFKVNGYVKSIQKAFDLKFSKNKFFDKIKEFVINYNKVNEYKEKNVSNKIYKNTNGYISLSLGRLAFKYSENGKENSKSFNITKYGYVIAMRNCLDLMFKKNDFFKNRIKNLKIKNYFIL